jgi:hypothetical protein
VYGIARNQQITFMKLHIMRGASLLAIRDRSRSHAGSAFGTRQKPALASGPLLRRQKLFGENDFMVRPGDRVWVTLR